MCADVNEIVIGAAVHWIICEEIEYGDSDYPVVPNPKCPREIQDKHFGTTRVEIITEI